LSKEGETFLQANNQNDLMESQGPMDLIHTDVCGPMQTKTPGGRRYFVSFTDDYSQSAVIQLLSNKNQLQDALEAFVNMMETQFDRKVKAIQSDRGGEFWNKEMTEYCKSKGIIHRKTNPCSSQENGVAERLNRTLMEKGRAMLQDARLGTEYWGEAVLTASYVRNRTVSSVHGKTPLEMLTGKKPTVDHLRGFGVTAYAHVPSQRRQKLDAVAKKGVFLGYEPNTKAYRILRDKDKRVVVSKDVTFVESVKTGTEEDLDDESRESEQPDQTTLLEAESKTPPSAASEGEKNQELPTLEEGEGADGEEEAEATPRIYPKRNQQASSRYPETEWQRAHLAKETAKGRAEPETYKEALSGPDSELWQKAMDEEIASLLENQTWTVEEVPPGVKPVPVKWVYKIKSDEHGNIERFKARVCAKGYKQTQGVDFEEVFAPVSRQPTLRTLLAVAAVQDLEVELLDVKTAFLNGDLEEDIWMDQPKVFEVGGKTKACHLQKALYGLKQAPRAWHLKLTKEMSGLGFEPSSADPSLFICKSEGSITYVAVWVDDCLVVGSESNVTEVKKSIGEIFTVRDLGPVKFFLGMEISRDRVAKTLTLTQKKATRELLEEFEMETAKSWRVPMGAGEKPTREGEPLDTEEFPYSKLVGSLLYLANCTRPDIAQAVGVLSRYMSCPTTRALAACQVLAELSGRDNRDRT
jgi:hypothetical protein